MSSSDWVHWQAKHEQNVIKRHTAQWTEVINLEHDLVCLSCYAQGPSVFCYIPMLAKIGRTINPMLVMCCCGAAMTFEEGLTLKALRRELTTCFSLET